MRGFGEGFIGEVKAEGVHDVFKAVGDDIDLFIVCEGGGDG